MEGPYITFSFEGVRKRIWRYALLFILVAYIWAAARAIL